MKKAHLRMLKRGPEEWNQWRDEYPSIKPDLSGTDLSGMNLSDYNLLGVDLNGADLSNVSKRHGLLHGSDLRGVNMSNATFYKVYFCNTLMQDAIAKRTAFIECYFRNADLSGADFSTAVLDEPIFHEATIEDARFPCTATCPDTGSFHAWADAYARNGGELVVHLLVPASAKRVCPIGSRIVRVSDAKVLGFTRMDGTAAQSKVAQAWTLQWCAEPKYRMCEMFVSADFNPDPRKRHGGIRCYISWDEVTKGYTKGQTS